MIGGACSPSPDIVVTNEPAAEGVLNTAQPASSSTPGTAPATSLLDLGQAKPERTVPGEPQYLLTGDDLPGWQYSRSMDFSAEPTFESSDCELMNEAWAAHAQDGTRIRASTDVVNLRQTVVEMPDAAGAQAVLDAADRVWDECVQFDVDGSTWWAEPVEMPDSGEWRTSALALGLGDNSIWIIGYWQLDNRIVFVDIDGDHPWDAAMQVLEAAAGRLTGAPAPAPAPNPSIAMPELVQPDPTSEPKPLPQPTVAPQPRWSDDPLASLIPEPGDIGPGWEVDDGRIVSPEPGGDQEIPGCDIPSPVTPPGIEVTFEHSEKFEVVEIQLMSGTNEEAASWPSSFRALTGCDLSMSGLAEVVEVPVVVDGADDAVVLSARMLLDLPDAGSAEVPSHALLGAASFDGLVVGVFWTTEEEGGGSVDDLVELIELIASKR